MGKGRNLPGLIAGFTSYGAVAALSAFVGLSCLSGVQAEPEPPQGPASGAAAPVPDERDLQTARSLGNAFTSVSEQVSKSVVSMRIEQKTKMPQNPFGFLSPFGPGRPDGGGDRYSIRRGMGSGVVIRPDGYILTNNHVVEDASHISVRMRDGRRYRGTVVGTDAATDLAVVKIDAENLPTARFASVRDVQVGQWVLAIGAPFGLDYTTTVGVVSALGRAVGMNEIEDYIQTDASINPGNSGGPLVDLDGKIVGINTMIAGRGTGIGFAVPANLAQKVAKDIIDDGKVRRAWIGVSFQDLTPRLANQLGLSEHKGALVSNVVQGGPAARAGVKPGDVIVGVDGEQLEESRDLLRQVLAKNVGDEVRLTVVRDGNRMSMAVEAGERPGEGSGPSGGGGANDMAPSSGFGLRLQPLTPGIARQLGVPANLQGVVVADVASGSPAARAGLREGDVIVEADRKSVTDVNDVADALSDGSALLRVRRGNGALFVSLSKDGN